jgi:hypothetical protein
MPETVYYAGDVVAYDGGTRWVKTGKAQSEQMFSDLPPITDIAQRGWHGRKVPTAAVSNRSKAAP